jgi:cell division septation protein DedD
VVPQPKKPDLPGKRPDGPAHFTLQLSAFPERGDAEEFSRKIQAAGYRPFVVQSEIPGKGIFYRVRVGDYATRQAAIDAKTEFERKQRLIAYVARL